MKNFGKYGLALAALFGLLLPACGGGGDNGSNTYISVQQFETGTKKFHFLTSPSVEVYAGRFLDDGGRKPLTQAVLDEIVKLTGGDGGKIPPGTESSGTLVQGTLTTGNNEEGNCDIAYVVAGGETGKGYMVLSFTQGETPVGVVNALAALLPDQVVQFTGDSNHLQMVETHQKVVPSQQGMNLGISFDFSSGLATLSLTGAEVEVDGEMKPAIIASVARPFIALDR